jgi:hypothetical protein
MQNSIVRPLGRDMQNVLIGFVGEHEARTFFVRTRDDLTGYTVGLVIDDVDCGAMTKAPMPDGSIMLSLTLTSDMLGKGGDKVCQLLMTKDAIVRKSSQFRAYVGASNDINSTAPDSATIIIISEKITELVHEAALDAIAEVQEVIDSIPADYRELSDRVGANTIALAEKADRSTTYTKTQIDQMIEAVEVETDTTLEIAGAPADAAETGRQIGLIKADLDALASGLSDEAKSALLNCFSNVAWIDTDGQNYYDTLHDALFPPTELNRISAVYTQSGTVYDTDSLDTLKADLVVTAHMSDNTTKTITGYTLTGVLSVGTSIITVNYGGKTTTFSAIVTEYSDAPTDYTWLYKASNGELLSENSNVSNFSKDNQNIIEEIVNGKLHISVPFVKNSEPSIRYYLSPATNNHAKMLVKVKFNSLSYTESGGALRVQLSKGSFGGARAMERRTAIGGDTYKFSMKAGSSNLDVADLILGTWYIVGIELDGNTQVMSINGETVQTASSLHSYATENQLFVQSPPEGENVPIDIEIEWLAYKNLDIAG